MLRIKVEPFIFPVSQCSRCWKLGHSIKTCPSNKVVCPKCGAHHANCETKSFKCVNCSGCHMALSRSCPLYIKEKRLREIMAKFNCTYKKAMAMYVEPTISIDYSEKNDNLKSHSLVITENTSSVVADNLSTQSTSCPEKKTEVIKKSILKKKAKSKELIEWNNCLGEKSDTSLNKQDSEYINSNINHPKDQSSSRRSFSDFLSRLKEIIYFRNCPLFTKVKNIFKLCTEWITLVIESVLESPWLQIL